MFTAKQVRPAGRTKRKRRTSWNVRRLFLFRGDKVSRPVYLVVLVVVLVALAIVVVLVALVALIVILVVTIVIVVVVVVTVAVAIFARALVALAVVVVVALVVLIAVLVRCAPKVLRDRRCATSEIGTRANLTQARIEYCPGIRSGQRKEQTSGHPNKDQSEFHGNLPQAQAGL